MDSTTTRLLTLLNVSAVRVGKKRKRDVEKITPAVKLNKRKYLQFADDPNLVSENRATESVVPVTEDAIDVAQDEVIENDVSSDPYEQHFGPNPSALTDVARNAITGGKWSSIKGKWGKLGPVLELHPEGTSPTDKNLGVSVQVIEKLMSPFQARQKTLSPDIVALQNDLLSVLSTHRDLFITRTSFGAIPSMQEAITLHLLNHITKKRRRVLKNNERLARASEPPLDVQDQGFTRPSALLLLPFRSSALAWFDALLTHMTPPSYQIENQTRFLSEFGLPPGTTDKLASAPPGTYPPDHVATFKGNVDDNFRVGVKLTRKSVKLFADFYSCDLIIASPLGLRMSIEKEKNADFLSSIEVLVVGQMDALTMQNWEHVQFVLSNMNQLPKESHDTDFSRIKPWYLDGYASYLRQSILLSEYETPEIRALFNNSLKNVTGKVRTQNTWAPVQVPEGISQAFVSFDCATPNDEAEKRFQHFTTQILPSVMKSAVQSTNTLIFIPSSFDFIRVQNYLRKLTGMSFTVLSEYSSNQDISRARQAFFSGTTPFLLMSERFHFYRRYKIRGIRNIIFYGPPDHPQFYTELLSFPFLDDGVDVSDVSCRVVYCRYDWMRLERIAGTEGVADLVKRMNYKPTLLSVTAQN